MSVNKLRPPLSGWIGGKSQLAKRIISAIPEHTCYCEVFAGAAWVLFRKPESDVEVINDYSRDVVNLYRVIRYHLHAFVDEFRWALTSRDEWMRNLQTDPDTLTDVQRAARFYYLQKLSFGGQGQGAIFWDGNYSPPKNKSVEHRT